MPQKASRQDQTTRGKLKMLLIYTSVRKKIGSKDLRNPAGPAFMVTKILGPEAPTTYSAWRLRAQNLEKLPSPKKQDSRTMNSGSTIDLST
jgi:hypothetical protein